jgi:hypothetical protein
MLKEVPFYILKKISFERCSSRGFKKSKFGLNNSAKIFQ